MMRCNRRLGTGNCMGLLRGFRGPPTHIHGTHVPSGGAVHSIKSGRTQLEQMTSALPPILLQNSVSFGGGAGA